MSQWTTAIFNGYKIPLPSYGKFDSIYGIFTSQGFVTCIDSQIAYYECMPVEYDYFIIFDGDEDEYKNHFEMIEFTPY